MGSVANNPADLTFLLEAVSGKTRAAGLLAFGGRGRCSRQRAHADHSGGTARDFHPLPYSLPPDSGPPDWSRRGGCISDRSLTVTARFVQVGLWGGLAVLEFGGPVLDDVDGARFGGRVPHWLDENKPLPVVGNVILRLQGSAGQ